VQRLLLAGRCLLSGTVSFFPQDVSLRTSGPRQVRVFEELLGRNPDFVFAHTMGAMCPILLSRGPLPPVFLDLPDIDHVKLRRYAGARNGWRRKLSSLPLQRVLLRGECRSIRLARRTFVSSELDRDRLMRRWPLSRIVTLPNAVSLPSLEPLPTDPTLLFLGTFDYWPNVDAVTFFTRDIWPRVRSAMPEARLWIAGQRPEKIPGNRILPGVEFLGFVDDLAALYRESRVVCCPIRVGGGTRIKILEAAAFGRPIVATTVAAEGLDMTEGRELFIRDEAASFAAACLDLLRDRALSERLARAARAKVEGRYDRRRMVADIGQQLRDALRFDQDS
jgi:glycosyltransferase involved in cell wall biosynthesis